MGKISLEITADASALLNNTDNAIGNIKDLAAQGKITRESLKEDFAAAGKTTKEFNDAIAKTVKELSDEGKVVDALILKYGSATKAQKEMQKELINMAAAGKEGTKEFKELNKIASELKDTIDDTRGQVKKLASDTSTFDKLVEAGRGVGAVFSTAAGAAALFGTESEKMTLVIQRAQGAMALLQGVQELANIATTKGGIATGIATAAQQAYTFVVGESVGALRLFRLALAATGIGALVFVLYEAADAFGLFNTKMDETTDKAKENAKAVNDLNESYNNLGRKNLTTEEVVGRMTKGFDKSRITTKELKDALSDLKGQLENVNSEVQILGLGEAGAQTFKDAKEAASAETKELLKNISAIESEIKAREKLLDTGKKIRELAKEIDTKGLSTTFDDVVNNIISQNKLSLAQKRDAIITVGVFFKLDQSKIKEALDKLNADIDDAIQKVPEQEIKVTPRVNFLGNWVTEEQKKNMVASLKQAAQNVVSAISDSIDYEISKNEELINSINRKIDAQEQALGKQKALQEQGYANSVSTEKKRLDELERQRQEAVENQKKFAAEKQAIDAAIQASSLITSAAQIYQSLASAGPVGVAVATVTVAAMLAAFVAAQIKAAELSSQSAQGFREGGYTGDGDPSQTSTAIGRRSYKYHKREFVANEQMTLEGRDFLEAWHKDDRVGMIFGLEKLLENTGVTMPKRDLPKLIRTAKADHDEVLMSESNGELTAIRGELIAIKSELTDYKKREKKETIAVGNNLIEKQGTRTITTIKRRG